jgi:hypothetical protein
MLVRLYNPRQNKPHGAPTRLVRTHGCHILFSNNVTHSVGDIVRLIHIWWVRRTMLVNNLSHDVSE